MKTVEDTRFVHGELYYPIQPPTAWMLVVVKGTFVLRHGEAAQLAEEQEPATGELFHEDDPTRSVRYPSDFALLKPRGECFVTGSCRPLTGRPVEQTVAAFEIGDVKKQLAIYGDRRWDTSLAGARASRPVPFEAMPLCWERAYGGPGFDANPLGRGIAPDENGVVWLPNIERIDQPVLGPRDQPKPATAFASGRAWKRRRKLMGTYDQGYLKTRFPWLPADFRFAYFNEAPEDQQIMGYWRGDETIALRHLHPTLPEIRSRLPGVAPRVFVERSADTPLAGAAGRFEEVSLVLDTLTVDADRGVVSCVWRGALDLGHARREPLGIEHLFVMDEPLSAASSIEACRARMETKIAGEAEEAVELEGEAPPGADDVFATIEMAPHTDFAAAMAVAETLRKQQEHQQELVAAAALEDKVKAQLKAAGIDPAQMTAEAEGEVPPAPLVPPDPDDVRASIEGAGGEMPEGVEEALIALREHHENPPGAPELPDLPPPVDLRAIVVETHRARRPLVGDFTGVDLTQLDLSGLDARDAILADANLRGAVLKRARLDGCQLARAELLSADLTGASLRRADLTDAVLEASEFGGTDLDGATLSGIEAMEANFAGATMRGADLTGAILSQASLVGAVCDEARFADANLDGCDGTDASFIETRIYGCSATGLKLVRADLTRVRIGDGSDLSGSDFRDTRGSGSRWMHAKLQGCNFVGATLSGADFTGAVLDSSNLSGCPLEEAVFQGASLRAVGLAKADVFRGSFRAADLSGADLKGANLYQADLFEARAVGVALEGVNLDGTYWART